MPPASAAYVEESVVGRSLGADFIRRGMASALAGPIRFSHNPRRILRCIAWLPKQYIETENRPSANDPVCT
jgi:hypothetical protein